MKQVLNVQARPVCLVALALALFFTTSSITNYSSAASESALAAQKQKDKGKNKEGKGKKSKTAKSTKAPAKIGEPALWEDRGNIAELDLFLGIGSEEGKPKPPLQFDKEDQTGTNPKIKVIDADGVKWNIKFDEEVHAEVAASRIVWACGYRVEESYFVPSGQVSGVTGLSRARKFVKADGSFTDGMFEKRPENIVRRNQSWTWGSNPFTGTKEMSGLVMLTALVNNWDAKDSNNAILGTAEEDGTVKEWYTVADWGGSFGKMGSFLSHSKWDPDAYAKARYIEGVSGRTLKLNYSGKMSTSSSVPLDHARWFSGILGQLTDDQLRQAFKAAGATPAETDSFTRQLRRKIEELRAAVGR
jgi:hypothetical protein